MKVGTREGAKAGNPLVKGGGEEQPDKYEREKESLTD